jgi:DNA-3-methyladenine glycosylase
MADNTLTPTFFERDVRVVARSLIGKTLVSRHNRQRVSGMIVETEAYLPKGDSASHAYRGPNRKNASMFGPAGRAYVYSIHARHCFNVVTEDPGVPSWCGLWSHWMVLPGCNNVDKQKKGNGYRRDLVVCARRLPSIGNWTG